MVTGSSGLDSSHPMLPSSSQTVQFPSGNGHVHYEQQANDETCTSADGVRRRSAKKPTTLMAKHSSKSASQETLKHSTFRTIVTTVSDFFKRPPSKNPVNVRSEVDHLRQEVAALQRRCAMLEDANSSVYDSCQSTFKLDIHQVLQRPTKEISQCVDSLSGNPDCNRTTTEVKAQANVITSGTSDQSAPTRYSPVDQILATAEGQGEATDVRSAIMSSKGTKVSTPLDQNGGAPVATEGIACADHEESLFEADEVFEMDHYKLPRRKGEALDTGMIAKLGGQSTYIDQDHLTMNEDGSDEFEEPPFIYQERLPRQKDKTARKG